MEQQTIATHTQKGKTTAMKCNHTQSWENKQVPTDKNKKRPRAQPNKKSKLHAETKGNQSMKN